jgi:subtilisin family serine protease
MATKKYPFRYFLFLLLLLLLAILFWVVVFGYWHKAGGDRNADRAYWNNRNLPREVGRIVPIDTTKIINDTIGRRRIVSNLVNIALKNREGSIAKFAVELKEKYPSEEYKIVYIDSVVSRLQVQLPDNVRVRFKTEVKEKMSDHKLLVWDETLFDYQRTFNDPKLRDPSANWYLKAINIDKAWEETTGNKDVVIAVIDNGFDLRHPELVNKAVKPYNVIDRSDNVSPSGQNHGTHVASTIIANSDNGQGIAGVCPDCSFMPIKVEDQNGMMSNTYIIDAILYAIKNKADVINLSLGMQVPAGVNIPLEEQKAYIGSAAKDEEEFWNDLFEYAGEQKVVCVLAAGNSNIMTGFDPFQRSESTIKVGAISRDGDKADFSNFGPATTIYAPGTNIFGAKPGNKYEVLEGTSMAAPIVSGLVGLMKSKNKDAGYQEILAILNRNSVTKSSIKAVDVISTLN